MSRYVALLRGVNVGGKRRLPMADLRAALAGLGVADARTYLQSGNVVLSTDLDDREAVRELVAAAVVAASGLEDVDVLVRTPEEMHAVLHDHPFPDADGSTLHATFLTAAPADPDVEPPAGVGDDAFVVRGDVVHVHCPGGYGRTKLTTTFLERALGVRATTRNRRTVAALVAMLEEDPDGA